MNNFLKCKLKPQGMKVKTLKEKPKLLGSFHVKLDKKQSFSVCQYQIFRKFRY